MPRKPPAEPIDHHYNIPRLNRVFFAAGIVLTVIFIGMVISDYTRDWKTIQRIFMRMDARKTREAALAARQKAYGEERQKLLGDLRAARTEVASRQKAARPAEREAPRSQPEDLPRATSRPSSRRPPSTRRSTSTRTRSPTSRRPRPGPARSSTRSARISPPRTCGWPKRKREESEVNEEIKQITAKQDEARASIEKLSADFKLSRQKFESLKQDALFQLRNSPILDMVNPSLRVQQVQLPEHFNDVNFMRIPRVDRCATCHVAADRNGFEDAEERRLPHPSVARPDGRQRVAASVRRPSAARPATAAATARRRSGRRATRPRRRRRRARWEKNFDWQFDRFNEMPILPMKYTEAGCYRCHAEEANFPDAPTARRRHEDGREPRLLGLPPDRGTREAGPAARRAVAREGRVEGFDADWATRWVMNPAAFRAEHEDADVLLPRELRERLRADARRPPRSSG